MTIEQKYAQWRGRVVPVWIYLVTPYGAGSAIPVGLRGLFLMSPTTLDSVWTAR